MAHVSVCHFWIVLSKKDKEVTEQNDSYVRTAEGRQVEKTSAFDSLRLFLSGCCLMLLHTMIVKWRTRKGVLYVFFWGNNPENVLCVRFSGIITLFSPEHGLPCAV